MAVGTAVVVGTAGAVRHRQETRYANQAAQQQADADAAYQQQQMEAQLAAQQQQIAAMQAAQAQAPAAPAAGMSMDDKVAALTKLAELQKAGILTEAEFAAQKAAILAS
jgi:hypothetical protein